jgi:hypothetical protein
MWARKWRRVLSRHNGDPTHTAGLMQSSVRSRSLVRRFLAYALLVAACGGSTVATTTLQPTTTEAPTTTQATTTTTVATTTTVDPVVSAGAYYVESVTPSNCAGQTTETIWDDIADEEGYLYDTDWERIEAEMLPAYQIYAAKLVGFVEALASYEWPESVQADIEGLMSEVSAEAGWAQEVSEASSFDSFITLQNEVREFSAAAIVRAKLGLPTNIGATSDC